MKVRIKELGRIVTGTTPKTSIKDYYSSNDYMFIGPSDLQNGKYIRKTEKHISTTAYSDYKSRFLNVGDICVSCIGYVGYIAKPTQLSLSNQQINSITQINENIVISDYLFYKLLSMNDYFQSINGNGSAVPIINKTIFENIEIDIHTLAEQQHIVDILGTLDETIENNESLIQKIEEKVLLEYDRINSFEPLSEIVMSDCFDITIGKTPPRKESHWFTKNSTDIKWLSISDLGKSSIFCFDTSERITPEGISKYNVKVVPKNTVVLSFKLTVGKVAITGCDMATNEAIAHFNSSDHSLLEYLYCYLKRYNFDTLGNTSSIATAVNSKTIKAMHFFIPDDTMLENFHHKTLPLFENIRQLLIENQKLNELKQLYLKKFFG